MLLLVSLSWVDVRCFLTFCFPSLSETASIPLRFLVDKSDHRIPAILIIYRIIVYYRQNLRYECVCHLFLSFFSPYAVEDLLSNQIKKPDSWDSPAICRWTRSD